MKKLALVIFIIHFIAAAYRFWIYDIQNIFTIPIAYFILFLIFGMLALGILGSLVYLGIYFKSMSWKASIPFILSCIGLSFYLCAPLHQWRVYLHFYLYQKDRTEVVEKFQKREWLPNGEGMIELPAVYRFLSPGKKTAWMGGDDQGGWIDAIFLKREAEEKGKGDLHPESVFIRFLLFDPQRDYLNQLVYASDDDYEGTGNEVILEKLAPHWFWSVEY